METIEIYGTTKVFIGIIRVSELYIKHWQSVKKRFSSLCRNGPCLVSFDAGESNPCDRTINKWSTSCK
ncbi:hypothetical protein, partial [Robiginitalea sp.]|uniref:hypothetical protein n=1 Tax=Robiginitalea sp. TaxID=1902411 RepID=UPI003C56156F